MFLRYQTGRGEEGRNIQQNQHDGEILRGTGLNLSHTRLEPRQEVASTSISSSGGGTSFLVPDSVIMESSTTYTNPGFIIVPQLTTLTESGSVIVKSQITVANIPAEQSIRPSPDDNGINLTALLTDTAPTPSPRPTMSSMTTTYRTTSSVATRSPTSTSSPGKSESDEGVSPILIFVVVLVIAIGVILSTVSIILYRRSKKRHQKILEERKLEKAATTLRPFVMTPSGGRHESLPALPPQSPPSPPSQPSLPSLPSQPSPPVVERKESGRMRKPSSLLPSPLHEFPHADFPVPPMIPRKNPSRPRIPIVPIPVEYDTTIPVTPPLNFKPRGLPETPSASSSQGSQLRIDPITRVPKLSIETSRQRLPSSSSLSIPSPGSRNKSLVSLESAIDPDLSFTVHGTSRLSTQVGEGSHENHYNSFTYWGDYDFSRRPFSRRRSTHASPTVTSPRLSPLGENSVWEDALMDVDYDSRTPTETGGSPRR
ncbi:hypothetical protein AOL_s00054g209 [Orbilia oligospora ATCC 24927]|uniref:Uncharacterized protein n=2 Tax=Orbilia oligospora TaxID=2813651 RepID=G1X5R5_ARTOA|nr:hypothetical protein AOL_s00054g209 [Orbilia oligospora ATCC 24927]EGX51510.1 hypothetical protein AOL_s00054g209 [Orbilia oligospora ATCC 24927]